MYHFLMSIFVDAFDIFTSTILAALVGLFSWLSVRRGVIRAFMYGTLCVSVSAVAYFTIYHSRHIAQFFTTEPSTTFLVAIPLLSCTFTYFVTRFFLRTFIRPLNFFNISKTFGVGFPGGILGAALGITLLYLGFSGLRQWEALEQLRKATIDQADIGAVENDRPLQKICRAVNRSYVGKMMKKYDIFYDEDKVLLAKYLLQRSNAIASNNSFLLNSSIEDALKKAKYEDVIQEEEFQDLRYIKTLHPVQIIKNKGLNHLLTNKDLVSCLRKQQAFADASLVEQVHDTIK